MYLMTRRKEETAIIQMRVTTDCRRSRRTRITGAWRMSGATRALTRTTDESMAIDVVTYSYVRRTWANSRRTDTQNLVPGSS
jgi:ribosomal protein S7